MKKENNLDKDCIFFLKSVRNKIFWSFGLLVILIIVLASFAYYTNLSVWIDSQAVRTINAPLHIMTEQLIAYDAMLTEHAHWVLLHSIRGEKAEIIEHKKLYDEAGLKLDNLIKFEAPALIVKSRRSAEEKELVYGYLNQLDIINLKLVNLETRAFTSIEKRNNDEAYSLIVGVTYHEYKKELLNLYNQWSNEEARIEEYYRQRALSHNIQVRYINLSLAVILVIFLIIVPIFIYKKVLVPIKRLKDISEEISFGNLDVKIPADLIRDKSEIGRISRAFNKVLESSHFALKTLVESKMNKSKKVGK